MKGKDSEQRNLYETVAGVRISHPNRVMDPHTGTRKIDLVRYFEWVAPVLLPHLRARPVGLLRAPGGIDAELFFQRHSDRLAIPHVTQHEGLDPEHKPLITIDDTAALVGAAQMDAIELHTWNAQIPAIEHPDRVVFDLDPDPTLPWRAMLEAAERLRTVLADLGLRCWCKTSGGKGLHVVVPLGSHVGWDDAKAFSQRVSCHMATVWPEQFGAKMGEQNRRGKIFIDYLRNSRGATTIAAYAPRARPGVAVSMPLTWDEVPRTSSATQWTLRNVAERLDQLGADPWADYWNTRQRVTAAMLERLEPGGEEA
ncbi:non-homologous end-joining DNA ligase [Mycetohabitans endofungorum]|nr:non-homologous end-joining DNA ligase [Mycetohabitans sp. B3]